MVEKEGCTGQGVRPVRGGYGGVYGCTGYKTYGFFRRFFT